MTAFGFGFMSGLFLGLTISVFIVWWFKVDLYYKDKEIERLNTKLSETNTIK